MHLTSQNPKCNLHYSAILSMIQCICTCVCNELTLIRERESSRLTLMGSDVLVRMLRLSQWSGEQGRVAQQNSLDSHCKWRRSAMANSGVSATSSFSTWAGGCLSMTKGANCDLADVITLAWCSMNNQTIS
jgi:hypothetical protein